MGESHAGDRPEPGWLSARKVRIAALSVLDLYMAVVSRWGPRRKGFYAAAPGLADVVRRVDADPRLTEFWAARFPFVEGWEDLPG